MMTRTISARIAGPIVGVNAGSTRGSFCSDSNASRSNSRRTAGSRRRAPAARRTAARSAPPARRRRRARRPRPRRAVRRPASCSTPDTTAARPARGRTPSASMSAWYTASAWKNSGSAIAVIFIMWNRSTCSSEGSLAGSDRDPDERSGVTAGRPTTPRPPSAAEPRGTDRRAALADRPRRAARTIRDECDTHVTRPHSAARYRHRPAVALRGRRGEARNRAAPTA